MSLPSLPSLGIPSTYTSTRALNYLNELTDDATSAIRGLIQGDGNSRYLENNGVGQDDNKLIKELLDSSRENDRVEGLTRVVGLITKGKPCNQFLPLVLKLSSFPSLRIRSLVYIILTRLGPSSPTISILSINSFQRDLNDQNPLVRGMALRALNAIRNKDTIELNKLALNKACRDSSTYVRKICAISLGKLYELDNSQLPDLIPILSSLLSDRSPSVLGAAMATFSSLPIKSTPNQSSNSQTNVNPDEAFITWDLLHPHFRKLCLALLDIDEWGQVSTLEVLLRYSRCNFKRPSVDSTLFPTNSSSYPLEKGTRSSSVSNQDHIPKDLSLLLTKAKQLLTSRNPAVITSVIKLFFHLTPIGNQVHGWILRALLRCLHTGGNAESFFILSLIEKLLKVEPKLFIDEMKRSNDGDEIYRKFLTKFSDSKFVIMQKLRILVAICGLATTSSSFSADKKPEAKFIKERESSFRLILQELKHNIKNPDVEISHFSVEMVGQLFRILNFDGATSETKVDATVRARSKRLTESKLKLNDLILRNLLSLLSIPIQGRGGKIVESNSRDAESRSKVKEVVLKVIRNLIQFREDFKPNEKERNEANPQSEEERLKDQDFSTGKILLSLSFLLFGISKDSSSKEKEKDGVKTKKKLLGRGSITDGDSRANIYWLLGQYCNLTIKIKSKAEESSNEIQTQFKTLGELIGPDLLRKSALNFPKESNSSKLEILTFSVKLITFLPTILSPENGKDIMIMRNLQSLNDYLTQLSRFDPSYEIRDRSRFCSGLIRGIRTGEEAEDEERRGKEATDISVNDTIGVKLRREQLLLVLFKGKPLPQSNLDLSFTSASKSDREGSNHDNCLPNHSPLTSLSSYLDDKLLVGWEDSSLPNWPQEDQVPDPKVRDPPPAPTSVATVDLKNSSTSNSSSSINLERNSITKSDTDLKNKVILIPNGGSSPSSGSSSPRYGSGISQQKAGSSKYKDLEAFLDETSGEEEEEEEEEDDEVEEERVTSNSEEESEEDDEEEEEEEEEEESEEGDEEEPDQEEQEVESEDEGKEVQQDRDDKLSSTLPPPLPPQNEWA